uniref:Uncharacterized protein n=1 Tax=Leclercia adecarboxylata TaxID=83655 RepID=A0A5B8KHN5_9ENTR|nr:Hypothetical protein [Leclercia adecarboxylata]
MLPDHIGLQVDWIGHNFISLKSHAGASVLTAWAAGLRHNIRKQNQSIIPVFNALSVSMKFKSPVMVFFGSQRKKKEIIADKA